MSQLSINKEVDLNVDTAIEKITLALKNIGFGILTRIDFDQKIKEKLNENLPRTVILGACNPKLAYEAYKQSIDTTLLIPCNVVVREVTKSKTMIEIIRPSLMLKMLPEVKDTDLMLNAEKDLIKALTTI